jgi:predicted transposase YbfD/YdcC
LIAQPTTPEQVGFPAAAQIGLYTSRRGKDGEAETVGLISSASADTLPIEAFLAGKRRYWTIENGLHQRLDGAANEDRSRVRTGTAPRVLAMFRRLPFGFYTRWAARRKPRQRSLQWYYDAMDVRNQRWPVLLVCRPCASRYLTEPPPG